MEKNKNLLNDKLKIHGISKVNSFEELLKYFDIQNLDEDGTPKIITEQKVLIVVDNEVYNETYLIDLINDLVEENKASLNGVKILYIDDFEIKRKLLTPNIPFETQTRFEYEKIYLTPCVFTINPFVNEFRHVNEPFVPFTKNFLFKILTATEMI